MKSMKRNLIYFTYVKQYFSIVCVVLLRYQSICKLGQVKIPRGKSDFNVTCPSGNRRKSLSSSTVEMASLISPSTAEVERSFSLMNLISTPPRKRLSAENLGHCMRIWNFQEVLPRIIINKSYHNDWKVLEPNQKAIKSFIIYRTIKELLVFVYSLFVFYMLEEKKTKILY